MNEQNQHSWEVNLEVVSRKGKQAYFCCYINPEGTTAATVTLRNLTQDVFFLHSCWGSLLTLSIISQVYTFANFFFVTFLKSI